MNAFKNALKQLLAGFGVRVIRSSFYRPPASCQIPSLGRIYEAVFGRSTRGFVVEVGAFDGETYSNSSFLADLGWRCLYIEPIREFAERCRRRHSKNDVVVVECAAGAASSTLDLLVQGEYTREADGGRLDAPGEGQRRTVPVRRLDDILEEARAPRGFELLIVDTEGAEMEVLRGLDLAAWQPRAVVVETNFVDAARDAEVRDHLERAGYVLIYRDMTNSILVRAECIDDVRRRAS